MKQFICLLACLLLVTAAAGCTQESDGISDLMQQESAADAQETREIPEGAIADASGDFVYEGKLMQVGDEENGYIQVPLGYVAFQEEDVEGLLQYSDVSGQNVVTLDHNSGIDYTSAANSMMAYMQQNEELSDVQGGIVTCGGYNAYQIYGRYADGFIIVVWLIEDPAHQENSYYLAIEFDQEHQYLVACSSTFETVDDHNAAGT
ncbi:MAG: hypothetical protein IJ055_09670 [Oscillospiraceae bacterium]|nr:hypothetical protein [Oscillospiraceae bacterium]